MPAYFNDITLTATPTALSATPAQFVGTITSKSTNTGNITLKGVTVSGLNGVIAPGEYVPISCDLSDIQASSATASQVLKVYGTVFAQPSTLSNLN